MNYHVLEFGVGAALHGLLVDLDLPQVHAVVLLPSSSLAGLLGLVLSAQLLQDTAVLPHFLLVAGDSGDRLIVVDASIFVLLLLSVQYHRATRLVQCLLHRMIMLEHGLTLISLLLLECVRPSHPVLGLHEEVECLPLGLLEGLGGLLRGLLPRERPVERVLVYAHVHVIVRVLNRVIHAVLLLTPLLCHPEVLTSGPSAQCAETSAPMHEGCAHTGIED